MKSPHAGLTSRCVSNDGSDNKNEDDRGDCMGNTQRMIALIKEKVDQMINHEYLASDFIASNLGAILEQQKIKT